MNYLVLGVQVVLVGVFLVSLATKVRSRTAYLEFVSGTAALLAVSLRRARPLAAATTWAEAVIVVLLAVPATAALGLGVAAVTLVCFAGVLVRVIRLGSPRPCRCFGQSATSVSPAHVVRNLVLAVLAGVAMVCATTDTDTAVSGLGATLTAAISVVCVVCVVRFDDLVELLS